MWLLSSNPNYNLPVLSRAMWRNGQELGTVRMKQQVSDTKSVTTHNTSPAPSSSCSVSPPFSVCSLVLSCSISLGDFSGLLPCSSPTLNKAKPQVSPFQYHIKSFRWNKIGLKRIFGSKKKRFKESVCKEALPEYLENATVPASISHKIWPKQLNINLCHFYSVLTLWS